MSGNLRDRITRILDGAASDPGVIDNADVAWLLIRELPELQARCDCQERNWADNKFRYGEHYGI